EAVEFGEHVGPARRRDAEDGHHRGDADRDADRGERAAQPAGPQSDDAEPGEVARLHARSPTTRPSRNWTQRGHESAMPRSCLMTTPVAPSACNACRRSTISAPVRESRFPVGSSARTIAGFPTIAL